MAKIIDITQQIQNKKKIEQSNDELMMLADLIKHGDIEEVVGIVNIKGIYYACGEGEIIKRNDFKRILNSYVDKIPSPDELEGK